MQPLRLLPVLLRLLAPPVLFLGVTAPRAAAAPPDITPLATAPERLDPKSGGLGDIGFLSSSSAWNGSTAVTAWVRNRYEAGTGTETRWLMLTRLNADGSGKDTRELLRAVGAPPLTCAVSAIEGGGFLVAWRDAAGLAGRYLDSAGAPAGPEVIRLASAPDVTANLAAAAGPHTHGVLWASLSGKMRLTLAAAWNPSGDTPAPRTVEVGNALPLGPGGDYSHSPGLAARGEEFLAAWHDGNGRLLARRVTSTGDMPAPASDLGSLLSYFPRISVAPLGTGGGRWVVAWPRMDIDNDGRQHHRESLRVVNADATPAGPEAELFPEFLTYAHTAGLWPAPDGRVLATRVRAANVRGYEWVPNRWSARWIGADGAPEPLSAEAFLPYQVNAVELRNTAAGAGPSAIVAARALHGPSGGNILQPLDAAGLPTGEIRVPQREDPDYIQQAPATAWDGSSYLCVWQDGRDALLRGDDIRLRALGSDGEPTGPSIALADSADTQISPAVAVSGINARALAVWTELSAADGNLAERNRIRGRLIQDGAPFGAVIDISLSGYYQRGVTVAGGVRGFLVAWRGAEDSPGFDPGATVVRATWVGQDGTVSHPGGFPVTTEENARDGAVACAGGAEGYMLVWRRGKSTGRNLYGAALPVSPPEGGAAPAMTVFPVCEAGDEQEIPRVVTRGEGGYQVLWKDARMQNGVNALFTATVSAAGVVTPLNGRSVALAPPRVREPALVPAPGGEYRALWLADREPVTFADIGLPTQLRGRRLTADGAPVAGTVFALPPVAVDADALEAAAGGNGGVLALMEESPAIGSRTISAALVFPEDRAPLPRITPGTAADPRPVLRWNTTRFFPGRADILETSPDLRVWSPAAPGAAEDRSTAEEGALFLNLPAPPGNGALFHRLRADLRP